MLPKCNTSMKKNHSQGMRALLVPFLLLLLSFIGMPKFDIFRVVILCNSFIIMALIFRLNILKQIPLLCVNSLLIFVNIVMSFFYWEKYVHPGYSASLLADFCFILYIGVILEIIFAIKVNFFRKNELATMIAFAPVLVILGISVYVDQNNPLIFPIIIFAVLMLFVFSMIRKNK